MISTARQLKANICNLAKEKSTDAQFLMRTYMMERLLERISLSQYKDVFILKGGVLIASLVGLDFRSTMDIDTTINGIDLNMINLERIMEQIFTVPIEDSVLFKIKRIEQIMDEAEYPGMRVSMQALFDRTITPLKVDISTGDAVTPAAIQYAYKLMFEDRHIQIMSYSIETVLAEKLETIVRRHLTNTRMRDFYDIYILKKRYESNISKQLLQDALEKTAQLRGSKKFLEQASPALNEIENSEYMKNLWLSYQSHHEYARNISWNAVMEAVKTLFPECPNQ